MEDSHYLLYNNKNPFGNYNHIFFLFKEQVEKFDTIQ